MAFTGVYETLPPSSAGGFSHQHRRLIVLLTSRKPDRCQVNPHIRRDGEIVEIRNVPRERNPGGQEVSALRCD